MNLGVITAGIGNEPFDEAGRLAGVMRGPPEVIDSTDHTDDITSEILSALSVERRREIVRHLVRSPAGTSSVDEFVATPGEHSADRDSDEAHDSTGIRLYHVDLPALADAGLIEYDWRSGDVSLTADGDALAELLERLKAAEWQSSDSYGSPAQ